MLKQLPSSIIQLVRTLAWVCAILLIAANILGLREAAPLEDIQMTTYLILIELIAFTRTRGPDAHA
ncbi:hypothetical protein [Brucella sp. 10RB9210]|uniref:hypothetical protein n=1 Tax=Brucella sp. 10RB9210 TaxID=1844037 RepID=UPI0012ADCA34|nr:hypothetical protein [Brucella sp. 10RB9210]MRN79478.1 hypothetical protein [Brucella sp. 10RB9210]